MEAVSWGIVVAAGFNTAFGLASIAETVVFRAPEGLGVAQSLSGLPFVELVPAAETGVGGSAF